MVKKEEKQEKKSKKKILKLLGIGLFAFLLPFIIAGLVVGLSYIIGGEEGENLLDKFIEFFQNSRKLMFLIILLLIVLNLLLMIFWKPARKVLPFIIYFALFLGTMIAYWVIDYFDEDDMGDRYAVVTERGGVEVNTTMAGYEL